MENILKIPLNMNFGFNSVGIPIYNGIDVLERFFRINN